MTGSFAGVVHEDSLPLGWAARPLPDGPELAGLNTENAEVLVADASLDEQRPHGSGDKKHDEDHALAEDLQRVEHKLNVLIQLVARLLKRDDRLPKTRVFRMHASGVEWVADGTEPVSGPGLVTLYVSRYFPQPLLLPGRFAGFHDDSHGRWIRFEFEGLAANVEELLARLIFRHHRRQIAGARIPRT